MERGIFLVHLTLPMSHFNWNYFTDDSSFVLKWIRGPVPRPTLDHPNCHNLVNSASKETRCSLLAVYDRRSSEPTMTGCHHIVVMFDLILYRFLW